MSMIVIMPGGFHPFHAGHFALYQSAKKAFPGAEVYVAATNDMSERPFPFELKEKLAKLAGVEPGHFVQVKSPFQAKEITQHYDPNKDVLVFVRSEKDRNESPKPGGTKKDGTPAYFQPWTGKNLQPFAKHAYFAYLPTVEFGPGITSATQIRKAWPTLNDKRKLAMVMSLYPATQNNSKLAQNVVGMFDQVMGGQVSEGIFDRFKKKKPEEVRNEPITSEDRAMIKRVFPANSNADITWTGKSDSEYVLPDSVLVNYDRARINFYKRKGVLNALIAWHRSAKDTINPRAVPLVHFDMPANSVQDLVKIKDLVDGKQNVDEGWKQKAAAAALAGTMATGASGIALNPSRIITPQGQTAANPYGKVDSIGNPIKKAESKVITVNGREFNRHELPSDMSKVQIATDDKGNKVYVWVEKAGMRPQYTYYWYAPIQEVKEEKKKEDDLFISADPESDEILRYAQQHYPGAHSKQQAFVKFVQRALKHSEDEDKEQDRELIDLQKDVAELKEIVKQLQLSESQDYIEEK